MVVLSIFIEQIFSSSFSPLQLELLGAPPFWLALYERSAEKVSKQTWCLTSTETTRLIRDGEKGGTGVWRWGERGTICLMLHCHHQNDFCIKVGSEKSHFNVSVGSDGQSHRTVSTNHSLFEEKGEPKRYRTEVLPLTSLTPYR